MTMWAASTAPAVAPFAGAWIETLASLGSGVVIAVAPFAGAWIETFIEKFRWLYQSGGRALRGRVD